MAKFNNFTLSGLYRQGTVGTKASILYIYQAFRALRAVSSNSIVNIFSLYTL